MSEIIVQPDNPMSTIMLFDAEKKSLDYFIDYIANTVESGMDDPLKVLAIAKKMEYITEGVKARIKEQVNTEAAKHGERPFAFAGCEMHLTPTYTSYDFTADPEWAYFKDEEERGIAKRKERETFLKVIKAPVMVVDPVSGEVMTVNPPVKKQTLGVKVSIK